jgi:hypothetical protein
VFSRQNQHRGAGQATSIKVTKGNINSKRFNAPISSGRMAAPRAPTNKKKEKQKNQRCLFDGILGILRAPV